MFRNVESVVSGNATHMVGDGFKVVNYFPDGKRFGDRMNPFLLMDFNPQTYFPPTNVPRGVGVHPHRGFETVTIAYKGSIAHNDSVGNSGVINPGDVQWMTAASGILHKEYHDAAFAAKGGKFEMVQLWVNLPRKFKMTHPKYQAIACADKGRVTLKNNSGYINVIAGEFNGTKGGATTFSPIEMYDIELNPRGKAELILPANFNTGLLVVEGEIVINENHLAQQHQYVQFENKDGVIIVTAQQDSKILLLSGEPINEPVASHGPFVMNTIEEIQQAIDDFNSGKFGTLIN